MNTARVVMVKYDKNYRIKGVQFFQCNHCQQVLEIQNDRITPNFGIDQSEGLVCHTCSAELDKQQMIETGKITLYLCYEPNDKYGGKQYYVTNWPGTLRINVNNVKVGKHNFGIKRYDIWFPFNGYWWYGVQYGDNTQICRCKQTKERSKCK